MLEIEKTTCEEVGSTTECLFTYSNSDSVLEYQDNVASSLVILSFTILMLGIFLTVFYTLTSFKK